MKLFQKELRLCLHPTAPMGLMLSAMVLIPNYPYLVSFFYTTLAIFFTCLQGRENNDVLFTMTLPVSRGQLVRGRIALAAVMELAQVLLTVPMVFLRQKINPAGNAAGMDANLALIGYGLAFFGLFNLVFFSSYYKNVNRVGLSFLAASAVSFLLVGLDVVTSYAVPFIREMDTMSAEAFPRQLWVLIGGGAVFALLTALAVKTAQYGFEKQDL